MSIGYIFNSSQHIAILSVPIHDMIVWDRTVGYNERDDSFTSQYKMILVLRREAGCLPYFSKDAVRLPYSEETIQYY